MIAKLNSHRPCNRSGLRTVLTLLIAATLICLQPVSSNAQQRLDVLARIGPWPVASNLIAYENRIWFSNSVKGRNHNSADIWSLDPKSGGVRYERHLFSQDAGKPVIFQGLLYWPLEDPRLSLGYGAISVTDGQKWRELDIRTAQTFHTHQIIDWGGTLVAITSAWRAGLQTSDDGGASWTSFYDHPTPPKRISRIQSPAVKLGRLYFSLRDPSGTRLVRATDDEPAGIKGWPQQRFRSLTTFDGSLYGIVGSRGSGGIWRSSGRTSEQLNGLPQRGFPVDLFASHDRLWAVYAHESGGYVASSKSGTNWRIDATFDGGKPHEMIAAGGQIIVAGAGADGKAIIWGVRGTAFPTPPVRYRRDFPEPVKLPAFDGIDWKQQSERLKTALLIPDNFRNHGRGGLREIVSSIVALSPPPDFLASHLDAPMAGTQVGVIGGETMVPARQIGQWILLWGMRSARQSRVPVDFLNRQWRAPMQASEKYFDPLLAALFTIANNQQKDKATLGTLIGRLETYKDPLWLQGDIIGTLNAITGQKFGYEIAHWSQWWNGQRSN